LGEVFYDQELLQLCFLLEYHPNNLHEFIKEKHPLSIEHIKVKISQVLEIFIPDSQQSGIPPQKGNFSSRSKASKLSYQLLRAPEAV
jgi:hypothetical protein